MLGDDATRWTNAKSVDEKLELLRQDITDIATAHNALAREFRVLTHRLATVAEALAALVENRQSNEASLMSNPSESPEAGPNADPGADVSPG
jgi:hypothetical protein